MAKFFNTDMADLAHQLALSPRRLRVDQLRGIETLLGLIEPAKAYPYDFICFHITKYAKRGKPAEVSVPGKALVSDLITTAEILSRKAGLTVAEIGQPCRTHAELAKELEVSTKTIRRWRNRGLMGLRLTYEDGVNRLAFPRSTIDQFVARNKALVDRGASFKQLSANERRKIIDRARQLVAERPIRLHAAAKLIADETGRAVETIRYTLRRFDQAHKDEAIFIDRHSSGLCERYEKIWDQFSSGQSIASIAAEFACSRGEARGILRYVQIQRWSNPAIEWVHNELFDAPNADEIILDAPIPKDDAATRGRGDAGKDSLVRESLLAPGDNTLVRESLLAPGPAGITSREAKTAASAPTPRIPKDLPPYLRSLYLTPLLSAEEEQDLFRRYNYLKFKASRLLKGLDPALFLTSHANETGSDAIDSGDLETRRHGEGKGLSASLGQGVTASPLDAKFTELAELMRAIDSIRQGIIKANLRLVVSVAKKHVGWSPNFFEVISDGNMSLMRAVEKFDFARGYKFSTYATWAVMKNYARSVPERHYHYARYVTGQEELLQTAADYRAEDGSAADREQVRQLIETGLQELSDREREIVSHHFGLRLSGDGEAGDDHAGTEGEPPAPMTLEQLGERYGVTKERVRQIEQRALARLRQVLSPTLADSLGS